jgi:hypothetical protein
MTSYPDKKMTIVGETSIEEIHRFFEQLVFEKGSIQLLFSDYAAWKVEKVNQDTYQLSFWMNERMTQTGRRSSMKKVIRELIYKALERYHESADVLMNEIRG